MSRGGDLNAVIPVSLNSGSGAATAGPVLSAVGPWPPLPPCARPARCRFRDFPRPVPEACGAVRRGRGAHFVVAQTGGPPGSHRGAGVALFRGRWSGCCPALGEHLEPSSAGGQPLYPRGTTAASRPAWLFRCRGAIYPVSALAREASPVRQRRGRGVSLFVYQCLPIVRSAARRSCRGEVLGRRGATRRECPFRRRRRATQAVPRRAPPRRLSTSQRRTAPPTCRDRGTLRGVSYSVSPGGGRVEIHARHRLLACPEPVRGTRQAPLCKRLFRFAKVLTALFLNRYWQLAGHPGGRFENPYMPTVSNTRAPCWSPAGSRRDTAPRTAQATVRRRAPRLPG